MFLSVSCRSLEFTLLCGLTEMLCIFHYQSSAFIS